jgi:hypothetical protein
MSPQVKNNFQFLLGGLVLKAVFKLLKRYEVFPFNGKNE